MTASAEDSPPDDFNCGHRETTACQNNDITEFTSYSFLAYEMICTIISCIFRHCNTSHSFLKELFPLNFDGMRWRVQYSVCVADSLQTDGDAESVCLTLEV